MEDKEIIDNSLMRLVSLSEYCDVDDYSQVLGNIVIVDYSKYCDSCKCQHYYIKDINKKSLRGDLYRSNLIKVNTRPYVISVTDSNGEITETQID
jgi:hypothetical protein